MRAALYARVSTNDQRAETQLDSLREYAKRRRLESLEFVDRGQSGAKKSRPALDELLTAVRRRGVDLVVCTKLDRIGRSVQHVTALVAELEALGVDLVVLDQGIDTTTPTGRLTFHVLAALAEFERDLIRERTREGLRAARRRGVTLGRPHALDDAQVKRARRLRRSGRSLRQIAEILGASKSAVHRAVSPDVRSA